MASCEMCGYSGELKQAIVEGSMMGLCSRCLRFGEVIQLSAPSSAEIDSRLARQKRRSFSNYRQKESDEHIVGNYALLVKKAREKMGKKQEDVAKALAERVTVLSRVEGGSLEPPLRLAKKLEQYFKIQLIVKKGEVASRSTVKEFSLKDKGLTIGDMVRLKK